jgi:hypothetical protein
MAGIYGVYCCLPISLAKALFFFGSSHVKAPFSRSNALLYLVALCVQDLFDVSVAVAIFNPLISSIETYDNKTSGVEKD